VNRPLGSCKCTESLLVVLDEGIDGFDRGGGETNGEEVINESNSSLMIGGDEVLTKFLLGGEGGGAVLSEIVDGGVERLIDDGESDVVA
jgi:hypothetical protein